MMLRNKKKVDENKLENIFFNDLVRETLNETVIKPIQNSLVNSFNYIFNTKDKPNAIYDSNIAIWSGLYRKKFLIDNNIKDDDDEVEISHSPISHLSQPYVFIHHLTFFE